MVAIFDAKGRAALQVPPSRWRSSTPSPRGVSAWRIATHFVAASMAEAVDRCECDWAAPCGGSRPSRRPRSAHLSPTSNHAVSQSSRAAGEAAASLQNRRAVYPRPPLLTLAPPPRSRPQPHRRHYPRCGLEPSHHLKAISTCCMCGGDGHRMVGSTTDVTSHRIENQDQAVAATQETPAHQVDYHHHESVLRARRRAHSVYPRAQGGSNVGGSAEAGSDGSAWRLCQAAHVPAGPRRRYPALTPSRPPPPASPARNASPGTRATRRGARCITHRSDGVQARVDQGVCVHEAHSVNAPPEQHAVAQQPKDEEVPLHLGFGNVPEAQRYGQHAAAKNDNWRQQADEGKSDRQKSHVRGQVGIRAEVALRDSKAQQRTLRGSAGVSSGDETRW